MLYVKMYFFYSGTYIVRGAELEVKYIHNINERHGNREMDRFAWNIGIPDIYHSFTTYIF